MSREQGAAVCQTGLVSRNRLLACMERPRTKFHSPSQCDELGQASFVLHVDLGPGSRPAALSCNYSMYKTRNRGSFGARQNPVEVAQVTVEERWLAPVFEAVKLQRTTDRHKKRRCRG